MDYKEIKIKGIWLFSGSVYDDLIMLETEEIKPFIIDGEEKYEALIINDEHLIEAHHSESGYVEIGDEVYRLRDLQVEERYRSNRYKYYFIGTMHQCSIIPSNDSILYTFQEKDKINEETVMDLIRNLRINKHREVSVRL